MTPARDSCAELLSATFTQPNSTYRVKSTEHIFIVLPKTQLFQSTKGVYFHHVMYHVTFSIHVSILPNKLNIFIIRLTVLQF